MIEKVLHPRNLTKAYRQVASNKGSAGIDGMKTGDLKSFIDGNRSAIALDILNRRYIPTAIKGTVRRCGRNPKSNGKTRLLGVPTVVDRWLQQAVSHQLAAKFEAVRRCDRVRRRKLWFSPAKEHSKGSTAKLEIHQ
jgi:RNA-directed DNA polymerase